MTLEEYQKKSRETALYADNEVFKNSPIIYPTLGLAGESGEVVDKIKKILRNKNGDFTAEDKKDLEKELGDVLWYLSQITTELGLSLDSIAFTNIEKLQSRLKRNAINSVGDNR